MDVYTKFTRNSQDKLYVYIHTVFQNSIAAEQCHAFAWFGKIYTHDFQNACAAEFSSTPIVLSYINLDKITYLAGILSHFLIIKERLIYFRYWFAVYVQLKVIK